VTVQDRAFWPLLAGALTVAGWLVLAAAVEPLSLGEGARAGAWVGVTAGLAAAAGQRFRRLRGGGQ
jgi:hypothetical protein